MCPIRTLLLRCRSPQHQLFLYSAKSQSFSSSSTTATRTKFFVHPIDSTQSENKDDDQQRRFIKEAETICRILSSSSAATPADQSSIAASLSKAGVGVTPELAAEILKRLSNSGTLALIFFRWAEKQRGFSPNADCYHHLIDALGKIKQFRLMWSLVDSMGPRGLVSKETFLLIIRRYARARKVNDAVQAFDKMPEYGLFHELSDYNAFLGILCKSRQVKRAQEILQDLKRRKTIEPDIKTFTILLEGWGQESDAVRMKAVFKEMIDGEFKPDAVAYGIFINALCKMKSIDEALEVFDEMKASGCQPTPHIYCTLINGLGSEKRLGEAVQFFKQSRARGFPPELPTYNALVGAYCWDSQFKAAYRVVDEMRKYGIGPKTRTFDIIIHHLIKAQRTQEAYRVFQEMGKEPGCEPEINTYTMMISMFCSEERVDMALRVWKQMRGMGILPCMHMFSALISGLCLENRLDDACQYFQEMLDKGIRPPGQLYSKLKEALLEGGKNDLAVDLGQKLDRLRKAPLFV